MQTDPGGEVEWGCSGRGRFQPPLHDFSFELPDQLEPRGALWCHGSCLSFSTFKLRFDHTNNPCTAYHTNTRSTWVKSSGALRYHPWLSQTSWPAYLWTKMYWKSLNKKGFLPGTSGCHTSSPDFYPSPTAYGQAAYAGYPGYSYPANTNSIASK